MPQPIHSIAFDVVKAFTYCLKNNLLPAEQGSDLALVMGQLAELQGTLEKVADGSASAEDLLRAANLESDLQQWVCAMGVRLDLPSLGEILRPK